MKLNLILRLMVSSITIKICVIILYPFNLTTLLLYMHPQNFVVLFFDRISDSQWTTGACNYTTLNYECMLNSAKVKVDKKGILWLQWHMYYKFIF